MIEPEKPILPNISNVNFICMDNDDLLSSISEIFNLYMKADDEIKGILKNQFELLLDSQYDRATLRSYILEEGYSTCNKLP